MPIVSEKELREFIAAMQRLRAENTATPEKARKVLKEEGFLDEDGELAKPYAPDHSHLSAQAN